MTQFHKFSVTFQAQVALDDAVAQTGAPPFLAVSLHNWIEQQ